MNDGVKRERLAYGPPGAEDDAAAQAKLLERLKPETIGAGQEQTGPEAPERQKKINEFTELGEVLSREIAELEEIVKSGVKVDPAGGAYDSANEEYANAMDGAFQGLLETKKGELHFINSQLENLNRQK